MGVFRTNAAGGVVGDLVLDLAGPPGTGPLHRRLTGALRAAIRAGRLPVGAALPPSRALAGDLGCSRWAVTEAYAQLAAEGYLEARTGSSTRVRWFGGDLATPYPAGPARTPPAVPPPVVSSSTVPAAGVGRVDLSPGLPDLRAFPRQRWSRALAAAAAGAPWTDLGHPDPGGHLDLRHALSEHLARSRGTSSRRADLLVTTSASDAVARACRALAAAGHTRIAVEDPGWTRLHQVARDAGLEVVPVPVDEHGLDDVALADRRGVRAVIVTPAHQFPTGVVLAAHRRAALLGWARRVDALIIEDDYDAEFRYDRPPVAALQGMDPDRVLLVGSVSKTLSPALGIGWALAPPRWAQQLRGHGGPSAAPPTIDQLALAALLTDGGYTQHLRAARRRYRARRDALVTGLRTALPQVHLTGIAAGLHLLAHLPPGIPAAGVVTHAARRHLDLTPLSTYCATTTTGAQGLVLGYGNLADTAVLDGVALLSDAVRATALRS